MSRYTEEQDDVIFSEPILAQKGVKLLVTFAEHTQWERKVGGEKNGEMFDACKLTLQLDDQSVRTEHPDAKPRLTIEDQFNIVRFPYEDKKTGEQKWLGKAKLYQLETALGFDPVFMANGAKVEPFITKTGNKVAPKIDGVKRVINPDFFSAYFNVIQDGDSEKAIPNMDNWENKTLYADVEVEESAQYGDRNVIARYVKAPLI